MQSEVKRLESEGPESTSWHTLSADGGVSRIQRVLWVVYNVLNNAMPRLGVDGKIRELKFGLTQRELDELWDRVAERASPARRLCDLFWMRMPWDALCKELGAVNALEIGCGSGIYGRLLEECLGASFNRYVGVDIKADEQWKTNGARPGFAFEVGRASDAYKFLPGSNLIITQSALEHFEEDLLYFKQVSGYVRTSADPILQVHLLPSASCITTFPWHGIREYTPRTISRITQLFGAETVTYLFSLGGSECNRIHRKFITWPNLRRGVDLRDAQSRSYRQSLRSAILDDLNTKKSSPAFYALVLASNFRDHPFMPENSD